MRRLMGKLNHPGPRAELKELDPPKGLGEQVRKLVLGVDVARLDAPWAPPRASPSPRPRAPAWASLRALSGLPRLRPPVAEEGS